MKKVCNAQIYVKQLLQIPFLSKPKGAHYIDGKYTVFGEIISGFNVLNKIAKVKTGRDERALEDVFIKIEVNKKFLEIDYLRKAVEESF